MASSENPPTPPISNDAPAASGIQTSSGVSGPAEAPSLPPPPPAPKMDADEFLHLCGQLDAVLVVLVVVFAFFVASFPAANPDFFAQAATGRLILHGEYRFGVDPFIYSADEGEHFVNHSWLFGVLMYSLYQLPGIGSAAVVIFKALLIAALAAVLLRAGRRPGQSLWIPASSTALAILALSPRLYLQSTCLSYFFLGLTLWLLLAGGKRLWLLPPLFALWVNCDTWFFLGPLTVALYLAGEFLHQSLPSSAAASEPTRQQELRSLGLVLGIGVAACLMNPHHIRAFMLPPELGLSPGGDLLENDPQFRSLFLSPLHKEYYQPYLGMTAAGLAYWPLLLLGLASFVLIFGQAPWRRLAVWTGFALLSLYNVRAIPFFAIVSGPIAALNWQDYAARLLGPAPRLTSGWHNWSVGGRVMSVVLGLALLIAAAPGWLHSNPRNRKLGWKVSVDPSLQAMAETIRDWRASGRLGEGEPNWFNMSTEVANYLAYFAPGERVYFDQSLPHFRKAAQDYETIRQALAGQPEGQFADEERETPAAKTDPQKILRDLQKNFHERHVRFWIYDNLLFEGLGSNKPERMARAILFSFPKECVLCYLKGRIAIFAWRDPRQQGEQDPVAGLALDLKRAAFGPEAEPAPPRGPDPAPSQAWWESVLETWWPPIRPRPLDADSAFLYELRYELEFRQQVAQLTRAWQAGVAAGSVAGALSIGPAPNNWLTLNWCGTYNEVFPPWSEGAVRPIRRSEEAAMRALDSYLNSQFFEISSLYLEIRAARRAVLADPEDGPTYFRLAQAYQRLHNLPHERKLRAIDPLLDILRRTQMIAAYQTCLRLPNLDDEKAAQAHLALYQFYAPQSPDSYRYIDAAVHHLREALKKRKALGPRNMPATQFNQLLDQMSDELTKQEAELHRRLDRYDASNAAGKSGLEKVQAALQEGLSETALNELEHVEEADGSKPEGARITSQMSTVALDLGQLDRARQLLPDVEEGQSVTPDLMHLYLRLAVARGDYAEADRILSDRLSHAWLPPDQRAALTAPIALLVSKVLLGEGQRVAQRLARAPIMTWASNRIENHFRAPQLFQMPTDFWLRRWRYEAIVNGVRATRDQAEWDVVRGWLALEAGNCADASRYFQAARSSTVSQLNWIPEVNHLNAWIFENEVQGLQQLNMRHNILYDLSGHYIKWLEPPSRARSGAE